MAKYSFEFKLMVVGEYISGQGGAKYLSKLHEVHHTAAISILEGWYPMTKKHSVPSPVLFY